MFVRLASRILLILIFASLSYSQTKKYPKPSTAFDEVNKAEAHRLWELAVEAKGGRDRLKAIRTMLETSDSVAGWTLFKTFKIHIVTVSEFPSRWWQWKDQRPSVFGLSETMHDYENAKEYSFDPETNQGSSSLIDMGANVGTKGSKLNSLIPDLLVTSWIEPSVLGFYREGKDTVIRTDLNGTIIDFAVDQKSHLPKWWKAHRNDGLTPNGWWLKDYKAFDGIMMPTHDGPMTESGRNNKSYQFNIEIDPSIWTRPPPYTRGENGWRKTY